MRELAAERILTPEEGLALWKDTPVPTMAPSPFLLTAEPVVIRVDGAPALMQSTLSRDSINRLRRALLDFPIINTVVRGAGIRNRAQVFGYLSRAPIFQRYACRASAAAIEAPSAHDTICDLAEELAGMLRQGLPDQWEANWNAASAVHPDWLLPGGLWTSGVVNLSSALPYHRDRNNLDAWSAMPVIRRGVRGGHLHLPELAVNGEPVVLPCGDGHAIFFNGQRFMHGVTPLRYVMKDGYRYSAVYYPVSKMRSCLAAEVELARAQRERTTSEDTLIARQRAQGYLQEVESLGIH